MPSASSPSSAKFEIRPLSPSLRKDTWIGAEVFVRGENPFVDPSTITEEERSLLRDALFEHSVLVFRKQLGIDPNVLPKLAGVWDDHVKNVHSGGDKHVKDKDSILSANGGDRIPRAPQVSVLGSGTVRNYEGIPEIKLKHVNQAEFHDAPLSEEELKDGQTRFYRWHMDAPLYERMPGRVTLIHGIKIPDTSNQKIVFENGKTMEIAPGATAFVCGARAYQLLSDEEKEFALNTTVQYAPRAYEFIRDCRATKDGLSIASKGKERPLDDLPAWTWEKTQAHPMVWKNPRGPEYPTLQINGCCVYALRTVDPKTGEVTTIDDIAEVRRITRSLQKKAMSPEYVYAHSWQEGDLVVFHNKGIWHSITGNLDGTDRLLWQCTMESAEAPQAYRS